MKITFKNNITFVVLAISFLVNLNIANSEELGPDSATEISEYSEQLEDIKSKLKLENGQIYNLTELPLSEEVKKSFYSLSTEEQNLFYQNRVNILKPIIQGLDGGKKKQFIGKLLVFKNRILKITKKQNEIDLENESMTLGKEKLQELVDLIDAALWDGCVVLSKVNQKGKSISLTATLGGGFKKTGKILGLSLGVGYYKDIQSGKTIIEFFFTKDSFRKAHTYALPSFVGVRVNWLSWRNSTGVFDNIIQGKGYSFPLWLPKLYVSPNEIHIASRFGIDLVDLLIPMQTAAQFYEINWSKKVYLKDLVNKNRCLELYKQAKGNFYGTH